MFNISCISSAFVIIPIKLLAASTTDLIMLLFFGCCIVTLTMVQINATKLFLFTKNVSSDLYIQAQDVGICLSAVVLYYVYNFFV